MYNIKVTNTCNNFVWEKQLTPEAFQQVKSYLNGKGTVHILPATLKPVRTNNLMNFSKDFFLPTTVNHAIKVQNLVRKAFMVLAALALDFATFPARLLTAIPRIISNTQQESSLYKFLVTENVDKELLAADHVRVRLDWKETSASPTTYWTNKDGVQHSKHSEEQRWIEKNVNFIEVPIYKGSVYSTAGKL